MQLEGFEPEELETLLANCLISIKVCCGTIFEETFYAPFSLLHEEIFRLIDSGHTHIAIAAPRGIGKTSIAGAVVKRAILYRLRKFILYVSNSATSAEMQTENIKRDLVTNRVVKQLFGNIKDVISENGIDESFSKSAWTAFGQVFVLPRGAGQQVRGLNWAGNRPGLIVIDDLEDKDEIQNEDNRKKLKNWFWSDLMKTESRYAEDKTIFIYIDTIKHEDSLLVDLLESPLWASAQLSICDSNYKSLDPNYMTDDEIKAEVDEHRRLGTLDAFYMERMNIPISQEDKVFKVNSFHHFKDFGDKLEIKTESGLETVFTRKLLHVTIMDPAKTVKVQSADSAIVTVAVDRESRRLFVRKVVNGKMYPDQLYNEAFEQIRTFNSFIFGFEVTGLSAFISQPIEQECRVRLIHPILVELNASGKKKAERVATLAPLYKLNYIYHNQDCCATLEAQLLSFPRSKLWDVMDALSYITYIMDDQSVFFDPVDDSMENPKEDEYADLDCESMMDYKQLI